MPAAAAGPDAILARCVLCYWCDPCLFPSESPHNPCVLQVLTSNGTKQGFSLPSSDAELQRETTAPSMPRSSGAVILVLTKLRECREP